MKHLLGHTSPETAFVVADYPYGFRLRCKVRYWLEYKTGHGYRLVSQTTNPKRTDAEVWNKPKASTYCELAVMVQMPANEKGIEEVSWIGLNVYTVAESLEEFVQAHGEALAGENEQRIIAGYRAAIVRYAERKAKAAAAQAVIA
jgi:hypothetical protein